MNKCPKCGAECLRQGSIWVKYRCDSVLNTDYNVLQESLECTKRQIAALQERLDAWRAWYIDPDQDRTRLQALNEL